MADSISERISNVIEQLPSGERKAAQTLVAEYPLIGLKTVAEYAARAGVSSPTILRFVSRLGFLNYADFQSALQTEVVQQLQSPLARSANRDREKDKADGGGGSASFVETLVENIRETFAHVSDGDLERLARMLGDAKCRLHLIGGRFTDPVARYMAAHLRIIRKDVFHIIGQESNWRDQLVDMGKRDVLVIFDIRRYQDSLVAFAEKAAQRGVAIVLFTDQWLSPIARVARHVVTARTAVPSAWDSSAALFALVEAVTARMTARGGEDTAARIAELEKLRGAGN